MKTRTVSIMAIATALAFAVAGCSASGTTTDSSASPSAATSNSAAPNLAVVNTWKKPGSVVVTAIPLGDGNVLTTTAKEGSIFACTAPKASVGSQTDGPWIHGSTWNRTEKVVVAGAHSWPSASFSIKVTGTNRVIVTNDLPTSQQTGTFPIAADDPAYQYDRNPNSIGSATTTTVTLPVTPTESAQPNCTSLGAVGVLLNGVFLFNALDGPGRDAVAHEAQDLCQGHPEKSSHYHYHEIPSCIADATTATSTIVGWAYDGYPIVVERDASGNLPNNADLDVCHGRSSAVTEGGVSTVRYHYSATLEYPYTIGCFHGVNSVPNS